MKTRYTLCTALAGMLLLATTNSCKKPDEGVNLIIETGFSEATVAFQFVDAVTGEQIGLTNASEQVEVRVLGADKAFIVDNSSASLDVYDAEAGFLTLAVEHGITPSAGNVLDFHINATAPGYLSKMVAVSISESGNQMFVVEMVKVTNTPDGVGAVVNNTLTANSTGTTAAIMTTTTPSLNTTFENTNAEFTVPAGTVLTDGSGQPVTGAITSTIVYFNNQDESATNAYPTGTYAQMQANIENLIYSAGVVSAQMRGNGREVKNFGSSVQMRIQVPTATENADGQPISDGMAVPVWSLNETTGEWVQEGTTTIEYNSTSGKYEATFDMTHLSWWMIGWAKDVTCQTGWQFTFESSYTTSHYGKVKVYDATNNRFLTSMLINMKNGSVHGFSQHLLPGNYIFKFYRTASDALTNTNPTVLNQSFTCGGSYVVSMTGNAPSVLSIKVSGYCADNPDQIIRPSVSVYAKKSGTSLWFYVGDMVNGNMQTTALEANTNYEVGAVMGQRFITDGKIYSFAPEEAAEGIELFEEIDPYICDFIN